MKKFISIILSIGVALFLADALCSIVDDSLALAFGVHALSGLRGLVAGVSSLLAFALYVLCGVTPMAPKRWLLPIIFFTFVMPFLAIPFLIYHHDHMELASWVISIGEVGLALWVLWQVQGRLALTWPLVPEGKLGSRAFSWLNLTGFLLVNFCILLPASLFFGVYCTTLAVDHFTASFLELNATGLVAHEKVYTRSDGKTIELMPMMHIGGADFYAQVKNSFPDHATILFEGVTDCQNLLENKISYHHLASTLGLSEQQQEFALPANESRRADIDISQFSKETIECLNLVMQLVGKKFDPIVFVQLLQKSTPQMEAQLLQDLLEKRNAHLWGEIQTELLHSNVIVVPWGAGHMPAISADVENAGFHLAKTQDFQVIDFQKVWTRLQNPSDDANNTDPASPAIGTAPALSPPPRMIPPPNLPLLRREAKPGWRIANCF